MRNILFLSLIMPQTALYQLPKMKLPTSRKSLSSRSPSCIIWLACAVFCFLIGTLRQRKAEQNFATSNLVAPPESTKQLSSYMAPIFLSCMEEVGRNLPIRKDGYMAAHHWDAATGKWNEEIRFMEFDLFIEAPLVMDVGGNVAAFDSQEFRRMLPDAEIHIYEPVPAFFGPLNEAWLSDTKAHIHDYGLGGETGAILLERKDLNGIATFIMDGRREVSNEAKTPQLESDTITMKVMDGKKEISRLLELGYSHIDLLHMNCEGCEWELLERLIQADTLKHVKYIQVSFHNYGERGIGNILPRYCLIREALTRTHEKIIALPFGWERWILKKGGIKA